MLVLVLVLVLALVLVLVPALVRVLVRVLWLESALQEAFNSKSMHVPIDSSLGFLIVIPRGGSPARSTSRVPRAPQPTLSHF